MGSNGLKLDIKNTCLPNKSQESCFYLLSGCGNLPGPWRIDHLLFLCLHHYWGNSCWYQVIKLVLASELVFEILFVWLLQYGCNIFGNICGLNIVMVSFIPKTFCNWKAIKVVILQNKAEISHVKLPFIVKYVRIISGIHS